MQLVLYYYLYQKTENILHNYIAMGDIPPNLLFDGFGKGRVISGLEVVLRFP